MKQRMYNTFIRIFKAEVLAKFAANIGYMILMGAYFLCRWFLSGKSRISHKEAYDKLESCSPKPNMRTQAINQEKKIDLSIIVPAYNAEKTIKECLDSVICQKTIFEYELIVINDGSTDKTRNIVEGINDSHIVLINQENKGFSGARNRGIDEATGNYIMFLDSDDYLVGDCIETMMEKIVSEKADIIQGSNFSFCENSNVKRYSILESKIIEEDTKQMVINPGFPWAKIYKSELFNNLRFPLDVWFEDTIVCMILFRLCKKMIVTDEVVYAYRVNPEGITQKARHSKKCIDHYWVMEYVLEKANELGLEKDTLQYEIVRSHMSTLLYRRISLMNDDIMESAFVLASYMLDEIRPDGYICKGSFIEKDIDKAFITRDYKRWKFASFVV